MDESFPFGIMT